MKKRLILCGILCALLVGCAPVGESNGAPSQTQKDPPASTGESSSSSSDKEQSTNLALEVAQTRLEYYEGLVTQLREELLAAKAELYTRSVAYEERIEALLAGAGGDAQDPSEKSLFEYRIEEEKVVITSYTGKEKNVEIPATVEGYPVCAIADNAFANNTGIVSVVVPNGVSAIGWFAFSGCVFLTDVTLPASVQSVSYGAFENCSSALTLRCPEGSYAQQYARSYGLRTVS